MNYQCGIYRILKPVYDPLESILPDDDIKVVLKDWETTESAVVMARAKFK